MSHAKSSPPAYQMPARILVVLLLAVAVAYVAGIGPFGPSNLQRARKAADSGDLAVAVDAYDEHLQEAPTDSVARLELAELLKPVDAAAALEQLREITPGSAEYPQAIWNIAHIATAGGLDDLAEESLVALHSIRPDDASVPLTLAELYFRKERFEESLTWMQRAVALQPNRAQNWLLLAEIFDRLHRRGEMLEPLRSAVELAPELYSAHAMLADAFHFAGDLEHAEREALWCLERQSDDATVRRKLAIVLRDRGEHDAAMRQIRRALEVAPANVESRLVEANLLLYRRQAEAAYQALKPLYALHSNRRDLLGSLARAAAMSGRRDEARKYQQEILELIDQSRDADAFGSADPE